MSKLNGLVAVPDFWQRMERKMRKGGLIIAALALAGGFPMNARADTVISAPQNDFFSAWGVPDTATYGNVVSVPTNGDTQLNSFTFYLGPHSVIGSGPIEYQAYVYAWDSISNMASGSALYSSALQTYTPGAGYVPITFDPSVNLSAGGEYALFFSTSGLQGGQPDSTVSWGFHDGAVSGLYAVYLNSGNNPAEWTSSSWITYQGRPTLISARPFPLRYQPLCRSSPAASARWVCSAGAGSGKRKLSPEQMKHKGNGRAATKSAFDICRNDRALTRNRALARFASQPPLPSANQKRDADRFLWAASSPASEMMMK